MSDHWAVVKAAVVALVVAALIWIWAEGESLSKRQTDPIELRFPGEPTNDLVIRADDPSWNGMIRVRLEGTVRAVDNAAGALGKELRLPAALEGMPTTPVKKFPLKLRDPISKLPVLANSAGVVAEVDPPEVLVTAERMVTRQFTVRVELAKPVPLDGDAVAVPGLVEARMPASLADSLGSDVQAVALVSEAELARVKAEGAQTLTVAVRVPGAPGAAAGGGAGGGGGWWGSGVVITPDTVAVSLRIKQALDSVKLPTVPVWFSLPPTEDGSKWNVEIVDKFLTDVTVSGASEDVQRVRSGQIGVKAVVEFTSDELERAAAEKAGVTKQVSFGGEGGLSFSVANPTVRVKVTKRAG